MEDSVESITGVSTTTNFTEPALKEDRYAVLLEAIQIGLSVAGVVLNGTAFIAFLRNKTSFGYPIINLLIHQAFLDMMACILSTAIHLEPSYWHVKNYYWEALNCYLWHSQYFFWYFLYTSANNLVYLAYDRYRAVVQPLHYKDISKTKINLGFFLVHLYTAVVRWPAFLFVEMKGPICVAGWVVKGKWSKITSNMYGIFEFFVHYLVHMVALFYLYGKVIMTSRKVIKRQDDTTSTVTQKALSVVTRASVAVTVVFVICFSWNSWNYTPGVLFGWFLVGSPWQKTNVIMGAINSACNPIFYMMFMPSFRRAMLVTFVPCATKSVGEAETEDTTSTSVASSRSRV